MRVVQFSLLLLLLLEVVWRKLDLCELNRLPGNGGSGERKQLSSRGATFLVELPSETTYNLLRGVKKLWLGVFVLLEDESEEGNSERKRRRLGLVRSKKGRATASMLKKSHIHARTHNAYNTWGQIPNRILLIASSPLLSSPAADRMAATPRRKTAQSSHKKLASQLLNDTTPSYESPQFQEFKKKYTHMFEQEEAPPQKSIDVREPKCDSAISWNVMTGDLERS